MGTDPVSAPADFLRDKDVIDATFDSLPGLFYVIDEQGRFLRWNKAFERVSGYPPEEIARLAPTAFFAGADHAVIAEKISKVFLTGEATVEADFLAKDGTQTPYFFTGRRIQIDDRPCLVGMGIDVTERRRAEHKFRDLLEAAPDAMIIADRTGNIVLVNAQAESMFGYARAEMLGRPVEMLIPERYRKKHPEHLAGYVSHPTVRPMGTGLEQFARRKDGTEFPVEISLSPIKTEDGTLVSSAIRDITARRQAEQELQQFGMAMNVSADSIYLTDPATMRFVYLNNTACQRLGYKREQLLQMGPQDVLPIGREQIMREYDEVIAARERGLILERPFVRSDGSTGITELHRRALHTKAKTLIVTIGRDITQRKQADERIRRLNRVYAVLSGINSAIVRIRDREELFRETCRIAVEHGGFGIAQILLVDEASYEIWPDASAGLDKLPVERSSFRPGAETISTQGTTIRAIRARKAVFVNDIAAEPAVGPLRQQALQRGYGSVISLPLLVSGRIVAVLLLCAKEKHFFDAEELRLLDELAGDISFCLDTIEKKEKLDYLAFYDQLTGLANRALFLERVNQSLHAAAQNGGKFAIAVLDIERLSTINESLGRQTGDELLKLVAERLMAHCGPGGVGRNGTDHFAMLLGEVRGRSQAGRIVNEMLQRCFGESFHLNDAELRVSAKAGVALFPGDGDDADMLLRNAEAALRKAKDLGERHVIYAPIMTAQSAGQLSLENKLRQALEKDEFVLHYQPKVDIQTRQILGVEALIRWQSPDMGLVPPGQFIPLMEETGLILEVGAWALRRAALDHGRWVAQQRHAPRIAVNVSAIQLRQRNFVQAVQQAIDGGAAASGIDLEITESLIMEDIEGNIQKLNDVRALGMRIAVDDFGTGYSSLGYLTKLPVQSLKIDRSFIVTMLNEPNTMTLVSTIISLAHSLRLKVVAEGVDQEGQAKILGLLRCDEMQGYLFSKPLPFEQMTDLLKRGGGTASAA